MQNDYKKIISIYIKAKDDSKPHLMKSVFSENAILKMKVQTENISFPADVIGVDDITEALVRNFNNTYENIYTVCLSDTVEQRGDVLACRWLVGMTDKASGLPRVGFGDYQWIFDGEGSGLVSHLTIAIDDMIVLPLEFQSDVISWCANLSYPWVLSSEVVASMPDIDLLANVRSLAA